MNRYIESFAAAWQLFDCVEDWGEIDTHLKSDWKMIAARDGSLSAYHFGVVHGLLRGSFKDCPSLRERVDHSRLKAGTKKIETILPEIHDLRHSIAHAGQFGIAAEGHALTEEATDSSGAIAFAEGSYSTNIIINRTYMQTINGKIATCEIGPKR